MRLRLVLAHVSGKLEFELRPRRLIKLNEFLDLLDRCNLKQVTCGTGELSRRALGAIIHEEDNPGTKGRRRRSSGT